MPIRCSRTVGAGLGVRYNLGFAPIRVDVGMPVTHRQGSAPFQIYVSIGQSLKARLAEPQISCTAVTSGHRCSSSATHGSPARCRA